MSDGPQDMMPEQTQTAPFIDGLYGKLVEGGIAYFFPSAKFEFLEAEAGPSEGVPPQGRHGLVFTKPSQFNY